MQTTPLSVKKYELVSGLLIGPFSEHDSGGVLNPIFVVVSGLGPPVLDRKFAQIRTVLRPLFSRIDLSLSGRGLPFSAAIVGAVWSLSIGAMLCCAGSMGESACFPSLALVIASRRIVDLLRNAMTDIGMENGQLFVAAETDK